MKRWMVPAGRFGWNLYCSCLNSLKLLKSFVLAEKTVGTSALLKEALKNNALSLVLHSKLKQCLFVALLCSIVGA